MRYWNDCLYSEDELNHFGILGMHWGKRNGPPYPLGYSDHTAEQKRKNNKKVIDGKSSNTKSNSSKQKDSLEIDKDKRFEQCLHDKGISDNTKKILIGSAVALGVVGAGYLAYKYNAVSKISKAIDNGSLNSVYNAADKAQQEQLSELMNSSLSDVDTVLKAGTEMHRQVGYRDFDLAKTAGDGLYTTYKESDTAVYRQFLKDWAGTGKRYDVTMTAMKDIKMPSDKKAVEIFNKVWNENPAYKQELVNTYKKCYPELSTKQILDHISKDPFGAGAYTLVKQGNDAKIMYSEIRKQGYNAIKDYFDAPITSGLGQKRFTDSPTILLNAVGDMKVKDISTVAKYDQYGQLFAKGDMKKIIKGAEAGNYVMPKVLDAAKILS